MPNSINEKRDDHSPPTPFDLDPSILAPPIDVTQLIGSELVINEALPGLIKGEATALLLDVNNLFKRSQADGFRIDYVRLQHIFQHRCDLRYCGAFSAVDKNDNKALNWVKWMTDKGYQVITKDLKRYKDAHGRTITKGNMDIDMTIAAMDLSEGFGHIILGSCDGDFEPLISRLKRGHHRKVSVLGLRTSNGKGMSESLVEAADHFYDLSTIKDYISYRGTNR